MTMLSPAPDTLGLASPSLGPWFSTDVTLSAPDADGSVPVAIPGGTAWLPPATGLLSLAVASADRPSILAGLRQADGSAAFTDGHLVALFTLLPEVEVRIAKLLEGLARVDGGAGTGTRVGLRTLAFEFGDSNPGLGLLDRLVPAPEPALTNGEKASSVGLILTSGSLRNGRHPMRDLKRPGMFLGAQEKLLDFTATTTAGRLWAFDRRGRCVDPGAAAAWLRRLTELFGNLWAPGITSSDQRTASTAAYRGVHIVNAHEGPLSATLAARLSAQNLVGTGALRQHNTTAAAQLGFTAAPAPDDAPEPRLALLPDGVYGPTVSLWAAAPTGVLARDFVRVGVVGLEAHLTGQTRVGSGGPEATRRAADQARPSTAVRIARVSGTGPVLLATADDAAGAVISVAAAGSARLVASALDRDWGALSPLAPPPVAPPDSLPALTATALTGGGDTGSGSVALGQRVMLEAQFDSALAGSWVRVWTHGFAPVAGRHVRLDGGAGRVRSDGKLSLVTLLPDGDVPSPAPMAVDVLVVTGQRAGHYVDQRFQRPAPVGGAPIALTAVTGNVVVCEAGEEVAASSIGGRVTSGATVVARQAGTPALVDLASLESGDFASGTIVRALGSGDKVELTQPAFRAKTVGATATALAATGASVHEQTRAGITRAVDAGVPIPTMERLEIAGAQVDAAGATAAIGGAPAVRSAHEVGLHLHGHPGAPAAAEQHGTGARLDGPAAVLVAEYVRDRVERATLDLAIAAGTPFVEPPAPTPPGVVAAVLRTVAAGVEAELGVAQAVEAASPFTFGDTATNIEQWLQSQGINVPASAASAAASVARALDRRLLVAARGAREAATALHAAFSRAEDLVYIETAALDNLALAATTGDELNVLAALSQRLDDRKALRVVLCLPIALFPKAPTPLQRVRDSLVLQAVQALQAGGTRAERVVAFCPGTGAGRALHLASTSVVVDDALALTGTTHLWRRGLSFDSSIAAAVFDENLTDGRPREVRRFRRALLAGRLGIDEALLPDDAEELAVAIKALVDRGGAGRLTTLSIIAPQPAPTADVDMWNPDGSPTAGLNVMGWITNLAAAAKSQLAAEVP